MKHEWLRDRLRTVIQATNFIARPPRLKSARFSGISRFLLVNQLNQPDEHKNTTTHAADTKQGKANKMASASASTSEEDLLGNFDIHKIMNESGSVVKCVLLPAGSGPAAIREVEVDTTPKVRAVQKLLGGPITFLGQYESEGTVIIAPSGHENGSCNDHKLQPPLHNVKVKGDILVMKVAEEGAEGSFFLDYSKAEYETFAAKDIAEFEVKANPDLGKELLLVKGDVTTAESDDDDEHSVEDDVSVEGESDSDDDDAANDMIEMFMKQMMEKFKSMHGRDPTEEEMKHIAEALQAKFGISVDEDDEDDEEEEDEKDGFDSKSPADLPAKSVVTNGVLKRKDADADNKKNGDSSKKVRIVE